MPRFLSLLPALIVLASAPASAGPGSTAAPAAPAASAPAVPVAPSEEVICRRTLKTGSLAQFERTCLTSAEWKRSRDRQLEFWQEQQGAKGSSHSLEPTDIPPPAPN
jgi:hypothetical protein